MGTSANQFQRDDWIDAIRALRELAEPKSIDSEAVRSLVEDWTESHVYDRRTLRVVWGEVVGLLMLAAASRFQHFHEYELTHSIERLVQRILSRSIIGNALKLDDGKMKVRQELPLAERQSIAELARQFGGIEVLG